MSRGDLDDGETEEMVEMFTVSAASFQGQPIPPREWLVEDVIPLGNVTLLIGDGGVGKSLLGLQLGVGVAGAADWIGWRPATGPVLCLSAEDELPEMHRRLFDILAALDMDFTDIADLHLVSLADRDAILAEPDGKGRLRQTALFQALDRRLTALRPVLLIVDNSADVFGGNEISKREVRGFIGFLRALAIKHGMAVLLLGHPSLAQMSTGMSGSLAWSNSVRSRLFLERPTSGKGDLVDRDVRLLRIMKANYGAIGNDTRLRWIKGTLRPDGVAPDLPVRISSEADAERMFLHLLDKLRVQGRRVSPTRSPTFAPSVFEREPENGGLASRAFERVMTSLLNQNRIRVEISGPPSKQRSYIVAVPSEP